MNCPQENILLKLNVNENESIKTAMWTIDIGTLGIAFVINTEGKFAGLVTDGDIRRAILHGIPIESPIKEIVNTTPIVVHDTITEGELISLQNRDDIKNKLAVGNSLKIPILNSELKVTDIILLYKDGNKPSLLSQFGLKNLSAVTKVLVIGCAGYLGSVLTRKLLSRGYMVKGLDNLMYGDYGIRELYEKEGFQFIQGDIRDINVLIQSTKSCDAVIHLAAIVGDPACQLNAEETISINYLATKMITEVCKYSQINRFIFASTCSVYGASHTPGALLTENSSINPVSLYAEMKLKSERAIIESIDDNFCPTILRMATLYGLSPRMRFDLVINLLTARAVNNEKITIFGGSQWRPFLHVDDAAEAYIKCMEIPIDEVKGQVFNLGSNKLNCEISELSTIIQSVIPDITIENRSDVTDERNYSANFNKIMNVLGYDVKKTILDGILEIKHAIDIGIVENYTDKMYSNYDSLSEQT